VLIFCFFIFLCFYKTSEDFPHALVIAPTTSFEKTLFLSLIHYFTFYSYFFFLLVFKSMTHFKLTINIKAIIMYMVESKYYVVFP
jgi:hypothetical protein